MTSFQKEPLAIVGIGCRFPGGVSSADEYWELIARATDAIVDVPGDRWDSRKFFDASDKRPGKTRVKQGGYLQQSLKEFDPLFFGISPREAAFTDPQQRLLLEVTWEAFEDAGLTVQQLRGSKTGVFIGAFNLDNLLLQLGRDNLSLVSASTAASVTMTILSNRLSYTFDLKGPSITLDTACSSSMVSVHYACQSIWSGDCDMAIAGGVNVISRPEYMVSMSKGGFLSPHGRCKSFDQGAAGYTRGEGAGILVLKTEAQAIADKDNIYAVIRNTGVNQDGYTQNGISFPSADAQRELIARLYAESGISPLDVSYVEAHGTGTQAGDPIEIASLGAVFAEGRPVESPCYVGSVKSNIGHTESAAGVAGIIKAALSIQKGMILPNLHFNNPNPAIDFAGGRISVPVQLMPWSEAGKPRMASVNSFGYGGTNGHIVLQEHKDSLGNQLSSAKNNALCEIPYLIPVSAKTRNALIDSCKNLAEFLDSQAGEQANLSDINYSLACRRSPHSERLTLVVEDKKSLSAQLAAVIKGNLPEAASLQSVDVEASRKIVFVFTGMGPQWWGMGRELYATQPIFKCAIDECDAIFYRISGWSIGAALLADEAQSLMVRTHIAQPANFLIQVGLMALYQAWGIKPAAVVGHSVGEVASAYAAGALSLEDALYVSYHRSRLQQTLAGCGTMLAVGLDSESAQNLVALYDQVSIAAVNSSTNTTLAGDTAQLAELAEILQSQGIFNRTLQVEVAYHSNLMDPIEAELRESLAHLKPHQEKIPLYSTAKGQRIAGTEMDADYWWQNVRLPVSFEPAIKTLIDDGYVHFIELGPHPVTRNFLSECLADKQIQGRVFSSLVRKKDEQKSLFESLGALFASGYELQWPADICDSEFVRLPSYPWQREHYWNESKLSANFLFGSREEHPLFFERMMSPEPTWQVEINENYFPFLNSHKISQRVVFPGAGYVEAGLALQAYQYERGNVYSIENLKFHRMLIVEENHAQQLQILEDRENGKFSIYAGDVNQDNWTLHATGHLLASPLTSIPEAKDIAQLRSRCDSAIDRESLYKLFSQRGLDYGEEFQTISEIHKGSNCVLAKISSKLLVNDPDFEKYCLYPTLLDGAFQSLIALTDSDNASPMVPVEIGEVTLYQKAPKIFFCYGEITSRTDSTITCKLQLLDLQGGLIADIVDLVCTEVASDTEVAAERELKDYFYEYAWAPRALERSRHESNSDSLKNWVLMAYVESQDTFAWSELIAAFKSRGISPKLINLADYENPNGDECIAALAEDYEFFLNHNDSQIVYFSSRLVARNEDESISLAKITEPCFSLIALAQYVDRKFKKSTQKSSEIDYQIKLNVVTRDSAAVPSATRINVAAGAVAAMAHLMGNEIKSISPRHIDIIGQEDYSKNGWSNFLDRVIVDQGYEDLVLQGEQQFIKKLVPADIDTTDRIIYKDINATTCEQKIKLAANARGELSFELCNNIKVGDHQVSLQVEHCILDENAVSDLLRNKAANENALIFAYAKVVAIGAKVSSLSEGARVLALISCDEIGNRVTISADRCVLWQQELASEQVYEYVIYALALSLYDQLGVDENDRLFVQNGFGALELALINLAIKNGVEVFATVNSSLGETYLRDIGVEHVFFNKNLTYVNDILALLKGEKFKAVVNNLFDEHFTACFRLLAEGGKYIQTQAPSDRPLQFPQPNKVAKRYTYTIYSLFNIFRREPQFIEGLIARIKLLEPMAALPKYHLSASNYKNVESYFSSPMALPSVIVSFDAVPIRIQEREILTARQREGTYLITGGTSGLGLEIAKWLITQGVSSLALVSRNGSQRQEAREFADSMQESGKRVELFDVDISDGIAVKELFAITAQRMLPLTGIIHCAMVLDDDFAMNMNQSRMEKVISPKALGVWNLHEASLSFAIEQFILISSISSMIGNSGQSNYVVANAFLDGFSHSRRLKGLPAVTINLGVLNEVGVVARDGALANVLETKGIYGFSTQEVLRGLGYIMNNQPAQVGFFHVDWARWAQESPKSAASSRFVNLVDKAKSTSDISPSLSNFLKMLEDQENYFVQLIEVLSRELAQIIRMPVEDIKSDRSISNLGIDSLMSVELSRGLRSKYGIEVSSMELLRGPSLDELAEIIMIQLDKVVKKEEMNL